MTIDPYDKAFLALGGAGTGASIAVALVSLIGLAVPPLVPIVGALAFSTFALATDRRKGAPTVGRETSSLAIDAE